MRHATLAAVAVIASVGFGAAAFAQSGQMGPAKTPNGSMPAAASNSTPSSGTSMGSGTMAPGTAMAPRKMRTTKKKMMRKKTM